MSLFEEPATAAERLLYDDAAPRVRRPMQTRVLRLRRPAFLILPLALAVSAAAPGYLAARLLAGVVELPVNAAAAGLSLLIAAILLVGLLLARREERSFALLAPNSLSAAHALLLLAFAAVFVAAGPLEEERVTRVLAGLPGPPLAAPHLQLFKAYCLAFTGITGLTLLGVVLLRLLGFHRVVAEDR